MYTREQIIEAIEHCLNEGEQQIIKTRFGIDDGVTASLSEIEIRFRVSREQVCEIEKRVLSYIRVHN